MHKCALAEKNQNRMDTYLFEAVRNDCRPLGAEFCVFFFDFIELLICTHQTIVYDIASRMPGASPPSTDRKRTDSQIRP